MISFNYIKSTHPGWHVVGVGVAVVVVEDEDGQHHAARHHPLDEVEVGPCNVDVNYSCKHRFLTIIVKTFQTYVSSSSIDVKVRHNDNPPNNVGGSIMWDV